MSEVTEEQKKQAQQAAELAMKARAGGELKEGEILNYESLEGNKYEGVLVFKKPTIGDTMRMGAVKSEILRTAGVQDIRFVDEDIMQLAKITAELDVVLHKRPECLLNLKAIEDYDLLLHVYGLYMNWLGAFRKDFRGSLPADSAVADGEKALDTP